MVLVFLFKFNLNRNLCELVVTSYMELVRYFLLIGLLLCKTYGCLRKRMPWFYVVVPVMVVDTLQALILL